MNNPFRLDDVARRIEPTMTWGGLQLPDATVGKARELCARARNRREVLDKWGGARRLQGGGGSSALFCGLPGSGKTAAAEAMASELAVPLFRIDLSGVVSKYIGETEKNLGKVFEAADRIDCVLYFDEADALFGKRSEVKDAHDRYANIEVSYLLQRLEAHDGRLTILATNHREAIDEAFARRFEQVIEFPSPESRDKSAVRDR